MNKLTKVEEEMKRQLSSPGSVTIVVLASFVITQLGAELKKIWEKVQHNVTGERRFVLLDLSSYKEEVLASFPTFCHRLALELAGHCQVEAAVVEQAWERPGSAAHKLTLLMEDEFLPRAPAGLTLTVGNVGRLRERNVEEEFFTLLRSWIVEGASSEEWASLRLVFLSSVEPAEFKVDPYASPFTGARMVRPEEE